MPSKEFAGNAADQHRENCRTDGPAIGTKLRYEMAARNDPLSPEPAA
jgi:hypothetical protein